MTTDQSQFGISKFVSCLSTSWPKAGYNYSTLTFILFLLINTFFVMEHCIYRVSNVLLGNEILRHHVNKQNVTKRLFADL